LALGLALLSYVRVSQNGLTYRTPEIWSNEATLALSTREEPEWRSELPPTAQPQSLAGLAEQYAAYATSDDVIRTLRKEGLLPKRAAKSGGAAISASAVPSALTGQPTPLLSIKGLATSPAEATRLTIAATNAFINYARSRQDAANIPDPKRVELRVVTRVSVPTLAVPRSKTKLIIILMAGLTATVAAAFIRDNMERAKRRQSQPEPVPVLDPLVRQGEPPVLNGSEAVRAAPEQASRSGWDEAGDGPDVPTFTRTRRSAGSSG
jgi:hypothetical protein